MIGWCVWWVEGLVEIGFSALLVFAVITKSVGRVVIFIQMVWLS
jgi:hypothetical protein